MSATIGADTLSDSYEAAVIKNFISGNDTALYESLEKMMIDLPDHPLSSLYIKDLVYLAEIVGPLRAEKSLKNIISLLSQKKSTDVNGCMLRANLALHMLYSRAFPRKAKSLSKELFTLNKWIILGPYRQYGPGDFNISFQPELIYDVSQFKKGKVLFTDKFSGEVDPSSCLYPDRGIAYAVTSFHSEIPVKIRIYSDAYYRAYVNRKEVISNTKNDFRNCRIIRIDKCSDFTLMLKLHRGKTWSFRTVVTDVNDAVIKPAVTLNHFYQKNFSFVPAEERHSASFTGPQHKIFGYSGDYFNELESRESIEWYQKSLSVKNDIVIKYLMADMMIRLSNGHKNSALYIEGWRNIEEIYKSAPEFIPAANKHLQNIILGMDKETAIKEGKTIIVKSPAYLPSHMTMLSLYSKLGLKKDFFDLLDHFKKRFPGSIFPLIMEYKYWEHRDTAEYIRSLEAAMNFGYDKNTLLRLFVSYAETGKYAKAMSLLKTHGDKDDWRYEEIALLIKTKKYTRAKNLIFSKIAEKDDPQLYYDLGIIDFSTDMDPSLYWGRMLTLEPAAFPISDYLDYKNDGKSINPFSEYTWDEKNAAELFKQIKTSGGRSTVFRRTYVFKLFKDGSSRFFCDEVAFVRSPESVARWGEYKIPYDGTVRPVHVRVFHGPDKYVDSYRIQKVDYDKYFIIDSLKENSLIHISYMVDNPINEPAHSTYFAPQPVMLQKYDEEVKEASCIIIAPEDVPVHYAENSGEKINLSESEGKKIYRYTLKNLAPVAEEYYAGNVTGILPNFSFSTLNAIDDFIKWYAGLLDGTDRLQPTPEIMSLKGGTLEQTLLKVYSYLSRDMELQKNILFYPSPAEDTHYSKRGTPEDKVVLAKSILRLFGIESYISLVPKKNLKHENYIAPSLFSHILLYVPVSIEKNLWFDFSNKYYSCGVINGQAADSDALVILKKGYAWKTVKETVPTGMVINYSINMDDSGGGDISIKTVFHGRNGAMREVFTDKDERDENISYYFNSMIPSLEIGSYSLENIDEPGEAFGIELKGKSGKIAIITADEILLKPVINDSAVYEYIRYKERKLPLVLSSEIHEKEEYLYYLPPKEYSGDNSMTQTYESKFGKASLSIERKKGSAVLRAIKEVKIGSAKIKKEDYREFIKFCMQIKNMESTMLSIR